MTLNIESTMSIHVKYLMDFVFFGCRYLFNRSQTRFLQNYPHIILSLQDKSSMMVNYSVSVCFSYVCRSIPHVCCCPAADAASVDALLLAAQQELRRATTALLPLQLPPAAGSKLIVVGRGFAKEKQTW